MRLRNQWLLLCVTLLLKLCTFSALCLALYVQPKSVPHAHDTQKNVPRDEAADETTKKDAL